MVTAQIEELKQQAELALTKGTANMQVPPAVLLLLCRQALESSDLQLELEDVSEKLEDARWRLEEANGELDDLRLELDTIALRSAHQGELS